MAYYKKRYKRKSYPRKKRIARTKKLVTGQTQPTMLQKLASGFGGIASVAKAVLPIVTAINTEVKYIDVAANLGISLGAPFIQRLTTLAQGTDENNRVGNSALLKDLNLRISIIPNYTTDPYNLIRYVIFVDKQQSGTPPTTAQLFTNAGNIDSPFNRNYTDRFVIIKDKRLIISQQGDQQQVFQKIYKKLDFHCRWIGSSSGNADAGNNQLYIAAVSTQVLNLPLFYIYSRVNFTDN